MVASDTETQGTTDLHALRSEEVLRLLVDSVKEYAIFLLDPEGRVATWNAGAERLKGYRAEEIIGRHFSCFYPPEAADKAPRELELAAAEGQFCEEGWRVRKDGTRFLADVTLTALRDKTGRLRGFAKVTRDVTERRRTEDALKLSEERTRRVLESALAAYIAMDDGGFIREWNAQAEKTFGWARSEAVGRLLSETIIPVRLREAHGQGLARVLATGEGRLLNRRIELPALHRDGHEFPVEVLLSAAPGPPPLFSAFIQDITERRRAQEEIERLNQHLAERAERLARLNQELEAFSYSVSHDLRAPLRAMQGFSQALLEDYADGLDETARDYARRIVEGAARMDALIQDILAYSRLTTKEIRLEAQDLVPLLDHVLRQMAQEIEARQATVVVDAPLPCVMGQGLILSQILENLLSNALKFVAPEVPPRIRVRAETGGGRVRLYVEDNGIGVLPEHRERIFGVFERLHGRETYPGTGIGLAIVRRGAERMGGSAGVDSEPGAGSRFWVELPACEEVP